MRHILASFALAVLTVAPAWAQDKITVYRGARIIPAGAPEITDGQGLLVLSP
jgi:hypothetical protein